MLLIHLLFYSGIEIERLLSKGIQMGKMDLKTIWIQLKTRELSLIGGY